MKKSVKIMLYSLCLAALMAASVLLIACGGDPEKPGTYPETGEYYCDEEITEEYLLSLSDGKNFTLSIKGQNLSGTYSLSGETLKLDFSTPAEATARYKGNTIAITYKGEVYTFYKKIKFRVAFNSNGGGNVPSKEVINGKKVDKPTDPVRKDYAFVGWYTDANCNNRYEFDSRVIENITLYAKWTEKSDDKSEYTISFNANYSGATENFAPVTTIAGKLFVTLPTPANRDGYAFGGWWISTSDNGDKLSYPVTENTVFTENTTLFAKWIKNVDGSKLATPVVRITDTGFAWDRVAKATRYIVTVTDPEGKVVVNKAATPNLTYSFVFETAGEYRVEVVAEANDSANNSDAGICYYTSKALAKVSVFEVNDGILSFVGVEHAQKYLITVDCGDANHAHTNVDIGAATSYDFHNCPMKEDGIFFTVKAVAEGYVTSTGTYVYNRVLAAVSGLSYDSAAVTVNWTAVDNAEQYIVTVTNEAGVSKNFTVTETVFSLKSFAAGKITVSVIPKAYGYNSPDAATIECEKSTMAAPADLVLNGNVLTWSVVDGAESYTVKVNGTEIQNVTQTECDLTETIKTIADGTECAISVKAVGASVSSDYSDAITAVKGKLEGTPVYSDGVVSWKAALGADGYAVTLNGGDAVTVNTNSAEVKFNKSGDNVITISACGDTLTITVTAYAVSFQVKGGSEEIETVYMAQGDKFVFEEPVKKNYVFAGWYNTVGGADDGGRKYNNGETFSGGADLTLYAYYTPKEFTVNYNFGTGGSGSRDTDSVRYGSSFKFIVPVNSSGALTFLGWYTQANGKGVKLTDENGNGISVWNLGEDAGAITVYAYWRTMFTFTENDDNGYTVTFADDDGDMFIYRLKEVVIPAAYNNKPVTRITDLSDGVGLVTVKIPDTVKFIAPAAFANCADLKDIEIYSAGAAEPVYFSEDGIVYTSANDQSQTGVEFYIVPRAKDGEVTVADGITNIPATVFAGSNISQITMPASVTYIAPEAFENCSNLQSVTILDSEQGAGLNLRIGKRAFSGCEKLAVVNLPARLDKDANGGDTDPESLPLNKYYLSITISTEGTELLSVQSDPDYEEKADALINDAFIGCVALREINVASANSKYLSVDGVLYNKNGDTLMYYPAGKTGDFTVPNAVRTIKGGAFFGVGQLDKVTVHYLGVNIGELAFYNSKIKSVEFKGNAAAQTVTLGRYAFRECRELASVTFADNCKVTEIGEGAFALCTKLGSVAVPKSVASIGVKAFAGCKELISFTFKYGAVPALGDGYIMNCSKMETVYLHKNVSAMPSLVGCDSVQNIVIDSENQYFKSQNGAVLSKDGSILYYCPVYREGEFAIPDGVREIATGAFRNNVGITKVTIPNTVIKINNGAFFGMSAAEILFEDGGNAGPLVIGEIPESATSLNDFDGAFEGSAFTSITLPSRTSVIDGKAFADMPNLISLTLNDGLITIGDYAVYQSGNLANVNIPSTVTEIGDYAFYETGVKTLTIANSVTKIGDNAFARCSQLISVTFEPGNIDGALQIANGNNSGHGAFYYCTALRTARLPSRLTTVPVSMFRSCSALSEVSFTDDENTPSKLTTINSNAFNGCGLNGFVIETGVTAIGSSAFNGCAKLWEVWNLSALNVTAGSSENGGVAQYAKNVYTSRDVPTGFITDEDGYVFYLDGEDAFLVDYKGSATELVLPATHNGKSYSIYDGAFRGNTSITSVTITDGVLAIGNNAFRGCTGLETVVIPNSITSIPNGYANGAFYDLKLKNVTIPLYALSILKGGSYSNPSSLETVVITDGTKLASYAFQYCTNLKSVTLPDTMTEIDSYAFYGCGEDFYTEKDGALYLGTQSNPYRFLVKAKSVDITECTIPQGVEVIFAEAFAGCGNLTEISIPDSVKTIGRYAFENCSKLSSVKLPASLTEIDEGVFYGCTSIANVSIPETVTSIARNAFANCGNMGVVILPSELQNLDKDAFYNTAVSGIEYMGGKYMSSSNNEHFVLIAPVNNSITSLTVHADAKTVVFSAFAGCASLAEVIVEEGNESYASDGGIVYNKNKTEFVFVPSAIKEVVVSDTITSIGDIFRYTGIESLNVGVGVEQIAAEAFKDCGNLATVTLNDKITEIKDGTFRGCTSLSTFDFENISKIGENAFRGTGFTSLNIPATVTSLGEYAFADCALLKSVTLPADYEYNGAVFEGCPDTLVITGGVKKVAEFSANGDGTRTLVKFLDTSASSFEIPEDVTVIGTGAFENLSNLKTVTFAQSSRPLEIQTYAFKSSGITRIVLPARLTSLGGEAFKYCASLEYAEFEAGCPITSLPDYSGGNGMFENCRSLKTIVMPENLNSVGKWIFYGISGLEKIYLPGYANEAAAKEALGDSWSYLNKATVIYNERP